MTRILLSLLFTLLLAGQAAADGLHVHVRKVETTEFPRVRVFFDVSAPDRMPFRERIAGNVRLAEEEVAIRDLEVKPHRLGVSIGLVVDDSGSEDPTLGYLKEATNYLVDQLAPYDEMSVVSFGRLVRPLQRLTSDKRLMKDAVSSLSAYGASALYDGIAVAMHESSNGIGRQVVVVVSDGHEQDFPHSRKPLSRDTIPHVIDAARHWGIAIYTVGIGNRVDAEVLQTLARETGGQYLHAPRAAGLRALFADIAESFQGGFQATYDSPNIKEDKLVRGGYVTVQFKNRSGDAPYTYTMRPKTDIKTLAVTRTAVWKDKFARVRVYTRGERGSWLEMEFTLLDKQGRVVRQGRTTRDGYGSPAAGGMPEMLELPPGTYALDLKEPGSDLVFHHPRIVLEQGRSTDLNYNYSKLIFRRNGSFWYDTEHALGDTSDLIDLSIADLTSSKTLRSGPMSVFKHRREASVWLEEGVYRIKLDNLIGNAKLAKRDSDRLPSPASGVEPAVLRNALSTDVSAHGGDVLFFDVAYDDLLLDQDPRLVPDELPDLPRTGEDPPMNLALSEEDKPPYERHIDALTGEPEESPESGEVSSSEIGQARAKRRSTGKIREIPNTEHDRDAGKPAMKRHRAKGTSAAKPAEKPAEKPADMPKSEEKPKADDKGKPPAKAEAPKDPTTKSTPKEPSADDFLDEKAAPRKEAVEKPQKAEAPAKPAPAEDIARGASTSPARAALSAPAQPEPAEGQPSKAPARAALSAPAQPEPAEGQLSEAPARANVSIPSGPELAEGQTAKDTAQADPASPARPERVEGHARKRNRVSKTSRRAAKPKVADPNEDVPTEQAFAAPPPTPAKTPAPPRDESDGSVFISHGKPAESSPMPATVPAAPSDSIEALAKHRHAPPASTASAPSAPTAPLPGDNDEVLAHLKQMRERAQSRKAESASAATDPLKRLQLIAEGR